MDGVEMFGHGMRQATVIIKQVLPEHFANDTPCSEWHVRDLAQHMLYGLSWVPEMVSGATVEDVGDKYEGDLIGDNDIDLSVHWQAAADRAETAVDDCDPDEVAHTSRGDASNDDYLWDAGIELLIHAWDLAEGIRMPLKLAPAVAQTAYERVLPKRADMTKSGLFAKAVEVSPNANIQTRLLALYGRHADWQPAA